MTISRIDARRLTMFAVLAGGLTVPVAGIAQVRPLAARAPNDSQPVVRAPVSPSRPPSAVAPRPRRAAQSDGSSATATAALVIPRISAPVDSVRPAPASVTLLDARRAPVVQPPLPSPARRTETAVQRVVLRAAVVSDVPPANATARCKDGTYLFTPATEQSCSDRGGLGVIFRLQPSPPTPPRRP